MQTRSYTAQDGSKRNVVEIIAESVEAVGGRQEAAEKPVEAKEQFTEVDAGDDLPF